MNTDFNNNTNLSYTEIVQMINDLKEQYKVCVSNYNYVVSKEHMYHTTINDLIEKIKDLENRLEYFEKSNKNLMFVLTRKLTIWERITGKIKL
jgi:6-phosphofructokinase